MFDQGSLPFKFVDLVFLDLNSVFELLHLQIVLLGDLIQNRQSDTIVVDERHDFVIDFGELFLSLFDLVLQFLKHKQISILDILSLVLALLLLSLKDLYFLSELYFFRLNSGNQLRLRLIIIYR